VAFWLALHHSPPAINGYADSTNTCCIRISNLTAAQRTCTSGRLTIDGAT
jgi:hypothetical protein